MNVENFKNDNSFLIDNLVKTSLKYVDKKVYIYLKNGKEIITSEKLLHRNYGEGELILIKGKFQNVLAGCKLKVITNMVTIALLQWHKLL